MQTDIHPNLLEVAEVQEADEILRSCVHCGFCTATCPTYQLLGDELDGPRGRIYLIKQLLETDEISPRATTHLDRCLTCRSCETTCPSGVRYTRLLDISRGLIADRVKRPLLQRLATMGLRLIVPRPWLFTPLLRIGQWLRPVLPDVLATKVPRPHHVNPETSESSNQQNNRRVILLQGCVQRSATPGVNQAVTKLLERLQIGVETLSEEGCCGALDYHLSAQEAGMNRMRQLIDLLYERLDGVEAVVSSASGCGVTIKEYPEILKDDPVYSGRAREVVDKVVDVSELLADATFDCDPVTAAFHAPCTLQHGQHVNGVVESILSRSAVSLTTVREPHLCCGSAGTYSILQPDLAKQLRDRKLRNLNEGEPSCLITANVGCQLHLESGTELPVMHWTELLARQMR